MMRNSLKPLPVLFTALLIVSLLFFSSSFFIKTAGNISKIKDSTATYPIDLPGMLDTTTFEAVVILDPEATFHKIKLPNGGTETNVYIYDSHYLQYLRKKGSAKAIPLNRGTFMISDEVLLDISHLSKGTYYVHYFSCGNGGIFPLTINSRS